MIGSSAGALSCVFTKCRIPSDRALQVCFDIMEKKDVNNRWWGLIGIWRSILQEWLETLLPENVAELCQNVHICVSELPFCQIRSHTHFKDKKDVVECLLASCHLPWVMDCMMCCSYREKWCVDGTIGFHSLESYATSTDENHILINPSEDSRISIGKIQMASFSDIQMLIEQGRTFAQEKLKQMN